MPTVSANQLKWAEHKWDDGHEWSPGGTRAGTELMWWRSIRPRVQAILPAATILEIAPGFGRWTSYLIQECERLVAVDVTERCVDICRQRFAAAPRAEFWLNDGESLPMVAPDSIDVAFSVDSLVHVEEPQVRAYLRELSRKLRRGGAGFFHHSNLGAYADASGTIPSFVTNRHWRADTMSARVFREACREVGLVCVTQEVINWIGRGSKADRHRLAGELVPLTDCLSTFVRPLAADTGRPTRVYVNRHFVDEWRQLISLSRLYGSSSDADAVPAPRSGALARVPMRNRLVSLVRRAGLAGTLDVVRQKLAAQAESWRSRLQEEATGRWYAHCEPIVRRLAAGKCPDCRTALTTRNGGRCCTACRATFMLE